MGCKLLMAKRWNQRALWEMKSTVKTHFKAGRLNLNYTPFNLLQSTRLQGLEFETCSNLKVAHSCSKTRSFKQCNLIKSRNRSATALAKCFVKISTNELWFFWFIFHLISMCLFLSYPSPWISLTVLNLSDSLLAVVCDVYEQIENVQGGQNRGINPEHRLQLKPTTQHLTKEGGKVLRKQLQQSHGIFFCSVCTFAACQTKAWSH